jgi:hypothetical protein
MDITELTEEVFERDKWIGKGKKYRDIPGFVSDALQAEIAIPTSIIPHLLSPDLYIPEAVAITPHKQDYTLTSYKTTKWFSSKEPMSDVMALNILSSRALPSDATQEMIRSAVGQKWLDGAQSIIDPRFNKGQDCFPLWVINYWQRMSRDRRGLQQWMNVICCLTEWLKEPVVAAEYHSLDEILGSRDWHPTEQLVSEQSKRREILKAFHAKLKEEQERGVTTGEDRSTRWTGSAGTSYNAAQVANANASRVRIHSFSLLTADSNLF